MFRTHPIPKFRFAVLTLLSAAVYCGDDDFTGSGPDPTPPVNEQAVIDSVHALVGANTIFDLDEAIGRAQTSRAPLRITPAAQGIGCQFSCESETGCHLACSGEVTRPCSTSGSVLTTSLLEGNLRLGEQSVLSYGDHSTTAHDGNQPEGVCQFVEEQRVVTFRTNPQLELTAGLAFAEFQPDDVWFLTLSGAFQYWAEGMEPKTCTVSVDYRYDTASGELQETDETFCCPGPDPGCG